jgi:hypothetical protein
MITIITIITIIIITITTTIIIITTTTTPRKKLSVEGKGLESPLESVDRHRKWLLLNF